MMAWSIVSKAFERSREIPMGTSLLSIADVILSVNSIGDDNKNKRQWRKTNEVTFP